MRVGTASWTDPTLTKGEVFYPRGADSAEERLRYYASRFSIVEVDSSYYALPARRMAELWAERTPDGFLFDVKANALMTGHPAEVSRLPKILRDALPSQLAEARTVYAKDLPSEIYDAVWAIFLDAIEPLRQSGKLGAVLMQYPRWFLPSRASDEELLDARRRLGEIPGAVEFRNTRWFAPKRAERTLAFLAEHGMPFVMVDAPQGMASSIPPVTAVTSPALAVLRLHGHRAATWEQRNVTAVERFRYLYERSELETQAPRVADAAERAERVHVIFNNCYGNYGTTNAIEFSEILENLKNKG